MERSQQLWVLDVSEVSGYRWMESWDFKIAKYGHANRVKNLLSWAGSSAQVYHLPVIISNQGLIHRGVVFGHW